MSRVSKRALRLAAAVAALSFLVSAGSVTTCKKGSNLCKSTTSLREYTGSPSIPCQAGHPVVQIDSQASCFGSPAGPVRVFRCGTSSDGFSYTGANGTVHSFSTLSNWENVLGDCEQLVYLAS